MAGKILRTKKENNFVQIDKRILNDRELSWQAKGLHTYLMSLPDNWVVNVSDLKNRSTNGRDSTGAIINELIAAGYVTRQLLQSESGKFEGYDYTIFEEKQAVSALSVSGETVYGKSVNGLSVYGKPDTNKNISNNITSTNIDIKQEEESEKNAFFGEPETLEEEVKRKLKSGELVDTSKTAGELVTELRLSLEQKKEKLPPIAPAPPKKKMRDWSEVLAELPGQIAVFINSPDGRAGWFDYLDHRNEIRAKKYGSAKSEALAIKHLYELTNGDAGKIQAFVNQSRMNGWISLNPLKEERQSAQQKRPLIYDPKNNEQYKNQKPAF